MYKAKQNKNCLVAVTAMLIAIKPDCKNNIAPQSRIMRYTYRTESVNTFGLHIMQCTLSKTWTINK